MSAAINILKHRIKELCEERDETNRAADLAWGRSGESSRTITRVGIRHRELLCGDKPLESRIRDNGGGIEMSNPTGDEFIGNPPEREERPFDKLFDPSVPTGIVGSHRLSKLPKGEDMSTIQHFDTLEQVQDHVWKEYGACIVPHGDKWFATWNAGRDVAGCFQSPPLSLQDTLHHLFYRTGIRVQRIEGGKHDGWEVGHPPRPDPETTALRAAESRIRDLEMRVAKLEGFTGLAEVEEKLREETKAEDSFIAPHVVESVKEGETPQDTRHTGFLQVSHVGITATYHPYTDTLRIDVTGQGGTKVECVTDVEEEAHRKGWYAVSMPFQQYTPAEWEAKLAREQRNQEKKS